MKNNLTYQQIEETAAEVAREYRRNHEVPELPKDEELIKYKKIIENKFGKIVGKIRHQISQNMTWKFHGYEHLEEVAVLAAWLAEKETPDNQVIEMAILSGLFHDIERWRGFGEDHMIEGEKLARKIMLEENVEADMLEGVTRAVRHHDDLDYKDSNKTFELVYGCVFDADHFRYGTEREDTFWPMKEKRGVLPEDVIHDYKFLPPLRNAWKTKYGKEVGPKLIDFGMFIAEEVEKRCQ